MVSIIVAMSSNNVIGNNGNLPWHLPADLNMFKRITSNKPVIMGRKTWQSLKAPLSNRLNIVISNTLSYDDVPTKVILAKSLPSALVIANAHYPMTEIMVIGGSEVYKQALEIADRLYLTMVHEVIDGDVYFPEIKEDWKIVTGVYRSKTKANPYNHSFIQLTKP